MKDVFDLLFEERTKELGWRTMRVFVNVYTCFKPDNNTRSFFVKTKGSYEYLRPAQYAALSKLDGDVFIAIGGDPEKLVPLNDFPRTFNDRGRIPNNNALSPNAYKAYKTKLANLEKQLEELKQNPNAPKLMVEDLARKLALINSKLIQTDLVRLEAEQSEATAREQAVTTKREELEQEQLKRSNDAFDKLMEVAKKEGITKDGDTNK